ncbi:MAG: hypothetical protein R3B99_19975 [Polyangiales bacterium]
MPYVALTALGLGLLAPFLRAWIWGVPLALFSTAMLLRAFLGEFLVAFFAGGVLLVALPPPIAAAVGGYVTLLLSSLSARRNRHLRALALVAYRLGQPDARDAAFSVSRCSRSSPSSAARCPRRSTPNTHSSRRCR